MKNRYVLIDACHGIYIPRRFAILHGDLLSQEDREILLKGPDQPHYWDVWEEVVRNTKIDHDGITFVLDEDNDLFAYSPELEEERSIYMDPLEAEMEDAHNAMMFQDTDLDNIS